MWKSTTPFPHLPPTLPCFSVFLKHAYSVWTWIRLSEGLELSQTDSSLTTQHVAFASPAVIGHSWTRLTVRVGYRVGNRKEI